MKSEYVNIAFHIFILFFKSKNPKIAIAEINIIIGLSITKTLNTMREKAYKMDCITVILKGYFFELLNIEKAKKPLIKYRVMLIKVRNIKKFTLFYRN